MREFVKSMASAGLASFMFGTQQLTNVVAQPSTGGQPSKATEAFNAMAQAAAGQCGDSMRETFHALDRIQRQAIDTGFGFLSVDAFNSAGMASTVSGFASQTTNQFQRWMGKRGGCGCDKRQTADDDPDVKDF